MSTYHTGQINEKLANQFCEASQFIVWLSEKMRSYDNAQDWVNYLMENLDVYVAEGYWLDLIGLIVGQPRTVPNGIPLEYFGFDGQPNIGGFGEQRMYKTGDPLGVSTELGDAEYRTVILAKVAANFADSTLLGIEESLSIIFNTTNVGVSNFGVASIRIYIGRDLTSVEKALITDLDLIPRAAGVNVESNFFGDPDTTFGFSNYGFAGFGVGKFVGSF